MIIRHVTVRQSAFDFLLPFHSNYGAILYRFPHSQIGLLVDSCEIYIPQLYSTFPRRGDGVRISGRCLVLKEVQLSQTDRVCFY